LARELSTNQAKHQILSRLAGWQAVSCQVSDTVSLVGQPTQHLTLSLDQENNPAQYVLHINNGTSPIEIVSNPREVVWYQKGEPYYAVMPPLPASRDNLRLMGTELSQLVAQGNITRVDVQHGKIAEVVMRTTLPDGTDATVTLTFDLTTNTPLRVVAKWAGGTVTEVASHFVVNPNLPESLFTFIPPNNAVATVGLPQTSSVLNVPRTHVGFSEQLPPSTTMETLMDATIGKSSNGASILLLTYQGPNGNPLLITERSMHSGITIFPSGTVTTQETVGSLSVTLGTLPSSQEMASFAVGKTLIVVEGEPQDISSLLNAWAQHPDTSMAPSSHSAG
jgi:outer membrane lipoprotein-sorting protein